MSGSYRPNGRGKGWRRQTIDWRLAFSWLRKGYPMREVAAFFDLGPDRFGHRAKEQLPPDLYAEYKRLVLKNRQRPKLIPHGTAKGYDMHKYRGEQACIPCCEARAKDARDRRAKRRRALALVHPPKPVPQATKTKAKERAKRENGGRKYPTVIRDDCGTARGWRKHEYHWETPCADCRRAIRKVRNDYLARKKAEARHEEVARPSDDQATREPGRVHLVHA